MKEQVHSIGHLGDRTGLRRRQQPLAQSGELVHHLNPLGSVIEQRSECGSYVRSGEVVLNKFRDDSAASDEVDHPDGQVAVFIGGAGRPNLRGIADQAFRDTESEWRHLVDDDKWIPDDGGLDGGGSTGNDGCPGVEEDLAGILQEPDRR